MACCARSNISKCSRPAEQTTSHQWAALRFSGGETMKIRRRPTILLLIGAVSLLLFGAADPASALSVSIFDASLTASISGTAKTFDGNAAVCAATDQIEVSASVLPGFDAGSGSVSVGCHTCADYNTQTGDTCPAGANSVEYATHNSTSFTHQCSASATDGHSSKSASLACPGFPSTATFTPSDLKIAADGEYTITIEANVSEVKTTTKAETGITFYDGSSCDGTVVGTAPNQSTSSKTNLSDTATANVNYILDIQPPSMQHSVVFDTITQGNTQAHDLTVKGASSGAAYKLSAQAEGPASTILGPTTSTGSFDSNSNGIASDLTEAQVLLLNTSCSTPVGTYADTASVESSDLCGGDWTSDAPPVTKVIDSSSDPVDFNIAAEPACGFAANAYVFAPLTGQNYEAAECFTSKLQGGNGKKGQTPLSDPGTVHPAAVITTPASEGVTNLNVTITLPSDFGLYITGHSPVAHVYIGAAGGFDAHSGEPLTEYPVTPSMITPGNLVNGYYHSIDVDLSTLNIGSGAGKIPAGYVVYVKTHANFIGPNVDQNDGQNFEVSASADGGLSSSGQFSFFENPTCGGPKHAVCVDGILDSSGCS